MSDRKIGNFLDSRLEWLYERNPAGPPTTILGMHDESGGVIGCGSIIPRQMRIGGQLVSAGMLADFAVSPSHRTAGPALTIQRGIVERSADAGFTFLFGYPNKSSEPILRRVGYQCVGETEAWSKPLRTRERIQERIRFAPAAAMAAPVVDTALAGADLIRVARKRSGPRASLEVLDRPDGRFDDLWSRSLDSLTVQGDRSASYLAWRYAQSPGKDYRFLCLVDRSSRALLGYAAVTVSDNKVAVVGDLVCLDYDATLASLISHTALQLRREGMEILRVDYIGPKSFGDKLRSLGFFRRPQGRAVLAYFGSDCSPTLRQQVLDLDGWLMLDAELDI